MQEESHDESRAEERHKVAPSVKPLPAAIADSRTSLDLIGDIDWTPQDGVHSRLLDASKQALDLVLEAYAYLADSSRDPADAVNLARQALKKVRDGDDSNGS